VSNAVGNTYTESSLKTVEFALGKTPRLDLNALHHVQLESCSFSKVKIYLWTWTRVKCVSNDTPSRKNGTSQICQFRQSGCINFCLGKVEFVGRDHNHI